VTFRGFIIVFIACFLIFFIALGVFSLTLQIYEKVKSPPDTERVVSDKTKAVMRRHGVDILFVEHNGNVFFYREGKKVNIGHEKKVF
jgi:uncharacterized membrane protein